MESQPSSTFVYATPLVILIGASFQGLQDVPLLYITSLVLSLIYAALAPKNYHLFFLFLSWAFGLWFGFMGMFNDPVDDQHPDWSISNIGLSSLIGLVFGIVYTLVFTGYRCLYSFSENDYINIMYFPLSFTAIFFILDNANIFGSWGNPAYSYAYEVRTLLYFASFQGLSGINFTVTFFVSLLAHFSLKSDNKVEESKAKANKLVGGFLFWSILVVLISSVTRLSYEFFFQRTVDYVAPLSSDYVQASCIVNQPNSVIGFDELFAMTKAEIVDNHASLIIWAETAMEIRNNATAEQTLLETAQQMATEYKVVLAVTYEIWDEEDKGRNMLAVVTSNPANRFVYQKAHPVPFFEAGIQPGPQVVPSLTTDSGLKIGGSICFDYDFPGYINQVSKLDIDIMIQPSWTWGPLYLQHVKQDRMRAVEHGFTLIRCASGGFSGVFGKNGEAIAMQLHSRSGIMRSQFPITKKTQTAYNVLGDITGWTCVVGSVIEIIIIIRLLILSRREDTKANNNVSKEPLIGRKSKGVDII